MIRTHDFFSALTGFDGPQASALVSRGLQMIGLWDRRLGTRHELLNLDDDQLRDIGVSRADANAEARKPFWRGNDKN